MSGTHDGERGLAVHRLPDEIEVCLPRHEHPQTHAHELVVVGEGHADHRRAPALGMVAATS
jgi:hypothetical protein